MPAPARPDEVLQAQPAPDAGALDRAVSQTCLLGHNAMCSRSLRSGDERLLRLNFLMSAPEHDTDVLIPSSMISALLFCHMMESSVLVATEPDTVTLPSCISLRAAC